MKNLIYISFLFLAPSLLAQVAIGKTDVDGSALLDFQAETNKGLILPWTSRIATPEKAAITFDIAAKKVLVFNGSEWIDLSIHEGQINTTEIEGLLEVGAGVVIGSPENAPTGVLALTDATKALVLPKNTQPWLNISSPEPGTITYDTVNKVMCVYNGSEWTFWGL